MKERHRDLARRSRKLGFVFEREPREGRQIVAPGVSPGKTGEVLYQP